MPNLGGGGGDPLGVSPEPPLVQVQQGVTQPSDAAHITVATILYKLQILVQVAYQVALVR